MAKASNPTTSEMIGKKAPAFTLPDQDGKKHKLSDYKGKWVVLYAYPKDSTPGCTKQSHGFQNLLPEFEKLGVQILGLSILDSKSKRKFADKCGLTFPLLADEDHAVAEAYGLWNPKKFMGKEFMGISRETFIIGPDGNIAAHWPKAKGSEEHAAEVLAWVKEHT